MRPSQNLPPPLPEYSPFSIAICDPPRIYLSLPEYTPFSTNLHVRLSQNPPPPLQEYRLTPLFNKFTCATFPETTHFSQNIPLFSTTICDPPRIYPPTQNIPPFSTNLYVRSSLNPSPPSQNTLPFSTNNLHVRPSQNLSLPPRIYPPFNTYMRPSQNLPLPPRIYPYSTTLNVRPSQNPPLPPRINPLFNKFTCATFPETTPPFQNIPLSSTTICDPPRIYPTFQQIYMCDPPRIHPSLPEYTPFSTNLHVRPS